MQALDISSCQNISHVGLSSILSSTEGLQQLSLAHGSPVRISFFILRHLKCFLLGHAFVNKQKGSRLVSFNSYLYQSQAHPMHYWCAGVSGHCSSCGKFEEADHATIYQVRWLLGHMFCIKSYWQQLWFVERAELK